MGPIQTAAKLTRPEDTPLSRQGLQKWEAPEFLQSITEKGGFAASKIKVVQVPVYSTTAELTEFATMLWSFIGGTSAAGWLESDEENWDRAVGIIEDELRKSDEFQKLEGGRSRIKFIANIAIATK